MNFYCYSSSDFSSVYAPTSFAINQFPESFQLKSVVKVSSVSLDQLLERSLESDHRYLLKIDAQGADFQALLASERLLPLVDIFA